MARNTIACPDLGIVIPFIKIDGLPLDLPGERLKIIDRDGIPGYAFKRMGQKAEDSVLTTLAQAETLRIGGKTFTEQRILTAITAQFLQKRGYDVTVTTGLGSTLARAAQESGQLDIVWEYTGSSLIVYNHIDEKLDAAASYRRVKQLDEAQGLALDLKGVDSDGFVIAFPLCSESVCELCANGNLQILDAFFFADFQNA